MTAILQNLALAQEVRLDRARLRVVVRSRPTTADGMRAVAEILTDPPACTRSMLVRTLLKWPIRARAHIAQQILMQADVTEFTTVGTLTYRQRAKLVDLLDERYGTERTAA